MKTVSQHPENTKITGVMRDLYDYWESIRGVRIAPAWRDFDWMKAPMNIIPWCAVVDVKREPYDFIYRFFGTSRATLLGRDYSRRSVREFLPKMIGDKAFGEYVLAAETAQPAYISNTGVNPQTGDPISYNFLRLPFCDAEGWVQQILSVGIYDDFQIKTLTNFYGTDK